MPGFSLLLLLFPRFLYLSLFDTVSPLFSICDKPCQTGFPPAFPIHLQCNLPYKKPRPPGSLRFSQDPAAPVVFGKDPRVYETTVKEFIKDESGKICRAVLISLASQKDPETGRTSMVPVEGSEREVAADLVLIAAGFLGAQNYVAEAFGVDLNARTNVETETGSYATTAENIFTAGDMHRGQSLVVWAIREGREAARQIDCHLMGYTNLA